MGMFAKVESNGKFVLKPSEYTAEQLPTFTQLTDEQAAAVVKILTNPAKALGLTKKAEKEEATRKYGRAAERVLSGRRHGFVKGNALTPLLREAAGLAPKTRKSNGGTRRQSQKVEQEVAQVVMASMPADFDLDSYLKTL